MSPRQKPLPGPVEDLEPITTTQALAALCEQFASAPFVTVDTEFLRETTYYPTLCLIQIASDERAAIIDPLAPEIDLAPFHALMANENVMKVFHAARQDLEIMFNESGKVPKPIFDTQIAAAALGYGDQIAYDQLVQRITGAHIDKSSRFTDWSRRPLTAKQLAYAIGDVTHLIEVSRHLAEQLAERGRESWIADEMAILSSPETYAADPANAWQRLKMRVRKPRDIAAMKLLAEWRERTARSRNVPRNRVLKDDAIFEIAQQQPRTIEALGRLRTVPNGFERSRSGGEVIETVEEALAIPDGDLPRAHRREQLPDWVQPAAELLRVLLKLRAEREGVVPRMLATNDELDRLAHKGEEAEVRALTGWRRDVFGGDALRLVNGELALRFVDGRIDVAEVKE